MMKCDIIYDMRNNKFYLKPSLNGMIYLNGNLLGEVRELTSGDRFVIGDSCFEFVAFCKGDRKWE